MMSTIRCDPKCGVDSFLCVHVSIDSFDKVLFSKLINFLMINLFFDVVLFTSDFSISFTRTP